MFWFQRLATLWGPKPAWGIVFLQASSHKLPEDACGLSPPSDSNPRNVKGKPKCWHGSVPFRGCTKDSLRWARYCQTHSSRLRQDKREFARLISIAGDLTPTIHLFLFSPKCNDIMSSSTACKQTMMQNNQEFVNCSIMELKCFNREWIHLESNTI